MGRVHWPPGVPGATAESPFRQSPQFGFSLLVPGQGNVGFPHPWSGHRGAVHRLSWCRPLPGRARAEGERKFQPQGPGLKARVEITPSSCGAGVTQTLLPSARGCASRPPQLPPSPPREAQPGPCGSPGRIPGLNRAEEPRCRGADAARGGPAGRASPAVPAAPLPPVAPAAPGHGGHRGAWASHAGLECR